MRDCGDFVGHQGARDGISHTGWVCFTDAMSSGRSARISLRRPTTEGDPVITTFTTVGDGRATVVTDVRADRYAGTGSGLQREICTKPDPRPEAQTVLLFLDCSAPEPLPSASARPSP